METKTSTARTKKTARLEARLDDHADERIRMAAEAANEKLSVFVVTAALERADRLLARADATLMPAAQFDRLIASLHVPDSAPNLSRAAARPRAYRTG
jgi:uncharacterized protein (DUF1778 family)